MVQSSTQLVLPSSDPIEVCSAMMRRNWSTVTDVLAVKPRPRGCSVRVDPASCRIPDRPLASKSPTEAHAVELS